MSYPTENLHKDTLTQFIVCIILCAPLIACYIIPWCPSCLCSCCDDPLCPENVTIYTYNDHTSVDKVRKLVLKTEEPGC